MAEEQNDTLKEQPKAQGGKGFIIGLAIAAVFAAGAGAGLAFMLAPKFAEAEKAKAALARKEQAENAKEAKTADAGEHGRAENPSQAHDAPQRGLADIYRGDVTLVRLKPVTTNLRKPFRAWVRLEGAIILAEEKPAGDEEETAEEEKAGKEEEKAAASAEEGEGKGEGVEAVEIGGIPALAALIQEDVHAYLRTLSLKDLEGAGNLAYLRDDLTERAAIRSGGRVKEFVILSLVVEE